jgi:hypothetical protein
MDSFWNFMGGIPWYGWVAAVAILGGVVVTALKAKRV